MLNPREESHKYVLSTEELDKEYVLMPSCFCKKCSKSASSPATDIVSFFEIKSMEDMSGKEIGRLRMPSTAPSPKSFLLRIEKPRVSVKYLPALFRSFT